MTFFCDYSAFFSLSLLLISNSHFTIFTPKKHFVVFWSTKKTVKYFWLSLLELTCFLLRTLKCPKLCTQRVRARQRPGWKVLVLICLIFGFFQNLKFLTFSKLNIFKALQHKSNWKKLAWAGQRHGPKKQRRIFDFKKLVFSTVANMNHSFPRIRLVLRLIT